jgi:methionyl aminopeptidase
MNAYFRQLNGAAMITYVEAETKSRRTSGVIPIHGEAGFNGMRKAGQLTAEALDLLVDAVKPGVTTAALDRLAYEFARDHDAIPATLFYKGYRHSICTSINHVVCHGIPEERPLREGDIVNIDLTLIVDGWYGDSSRMYPVGEISRKAERLIDVTYAGLAAGIAAAKAGATTGDIGAAIQALAEAERMSVVRDFVGHGVGQLFHDEPNIMHFGVPGTGVPLKPGMIFTIEPMINLGRPHVKILADGWTAVTRDRTLSAQAEHSIGITETGVEIFTTSPRGLFNPLDARR